MFCPSCGKQIDDQAKFCPFCGTAITSQNTARAIPVQPVQAVPVQETNAQTEIPIAATPAFAAAHSEKGAPVGGKKQKKEKKPKAPKAQKHPKAASEFGSGGKQGFSVSVGTALTAAFLLMELLPYLLRSLLMIIGKTALSAPLSCICSIAGYALAGGVLFLCSKLMQGRSPLPSALLFVGILGAYRTAVPLIMPLANSSKVIVSIIVYAVIVVVSIIAAFALTVPLCSLFISDEQKHDGRVLAALCILLAFIVPDTLQTMFFFISTERTPSFLGSAAGFILIAMLESALFTLGAKVIIKMKRSKAAKVPAAKRSLIVGGAVSAAAAVMLFIGSASENVLTIAAKDVVATLVSADYLLATGDMVIAENYFKLTGEHARAWSEAANGGYSVPSEYSDDSMLLYLSFLSSEDRLKKYMTTDFDPSDIDIFGPLMLEHYGDNEELSDEDKAHRKEVIDLCIGSGVFTSRYPTIKAIDKNSGDLVKLADAEGSYSKYMRLAEIFGAVQKGESSASTAIHDFLKLAEEYPDDFRIQAIASIVGSENKSDGAGHYEKTGEAILRFVRCIDNDPEIIGGSENVPKSKTTAADMLMKVNQYEKAENVLNDVLASDPTSKTAKQLLARCYMELDKTGKSYELAKEMSSDYPDDVTVLWTLCVCSLSNDNTTEAIDAASKLADAVKNGDLGGDSLLFNCASELSLSGFSSGRDHNVYSEDTSDEPVKQIKKNEFLDNYCAAIYYEKQHTDYDLALKHVDKALEFQKDSSRLWYLKGLIHYNREEYEKSEEALLKADSLDPNELSIMYALANTYDLMGEYEKAYDYCERCIAKYPNGADHDEDVYGAMPHAGLLKNQLESYVKKGGK